MPSMGSSGPRLWPSFASRGWPSTYASSAKPRPARSGSSGTASRNGSSRCAAVAVARGPTTCGSPTTKSNRSAYRATTRDWGRCGQQGAGTGRRIAILICMYTTQLADEVRPRGKSDEESLREVGFRWGNKGTHTSRTIMLDELRAVLAKCSPPTRHATPTSHQSTRTIYWQDSSTGCSSYRNPNFPPII